MPRITSDANVDESTIASNELVKLGLDQNTIVIYSSDQGYTEIMLVRQKMMYEESLEMP